MKPNLLILISILLIIVIYIGTNTSEKFDILSDKDLDPSQNYKSDTDDSKPSYNTGLSYQPVQSINCCLVEKKYLPDNSNQYGGSFKYKYKKLSNENCDLKLFRLDSNKQLFFEGENEWSNEFCSSKKNKLGSCRFVNKECIDFVDQDYCKKFNMTWSNKTCHDPLDFKWVDRINLKVPKLKGDGKYVMFDQVSDLGKNKKK
jgi:hypothetical protein